MSGWLVYLGVAALVTTMRFAGFTLHITSPRGQRFLRFVPVSVFAALVVSSLFKDPSSLDLKLIALAVAGIVSWRTHQFGLSVFAGLAALWLLAQV